MRSHHHNAPRCCNSVNTPSTTRPISCGSGPADGSLGNGDGPPSPCSASNCPSVFSRSLSAERCCCDSGCRPVPIWNPRRATAVRENRPGKGSLPSRFVRFLREVVAELRKVIWPTRNQLVTYTIVVLVFVSFMVALVSGLDYVFGWGVQFLFGTP